MPVGGVDEGLRFPGPEDGLQVVEAGAGESDELVRRLSARSGAGSALEVPDLGIGPADLAMYGAVGDALFAP